MGPAIGEILPIAIGVAISPIPIIAVVLMLSTPKGKGNGLAFLVGWLLGLVLVGVTVLLVADPAGASEDGGPATWVGWLLLVLGLLAVLIGIRSWRGRPQGDEEPPMPKWMSAIDQFTAGKSLGLGFLLAALNPKNLTLTLAAAASIAAAGLSSTDSYIVLAVFVVIGTIGLAIPIGIYFLGGDTAAGTLADLRHWLAINNATIMAVLMVVIGAKLIGSGMQVVFA
jgi:threonine/homoserine/homoserine lactone efflux protein